MNRDKWIRCRSASRLLIKATEELGEVSNEYIDLADCASEREREVVMLRMREEIGHAHFILDCLDSLLAVQLGTLPSDRVGI